MTVVFHLLRRILQRGDLHQIWSELQVPDSAKQALKEARYNGHLLFTNSGLTYTMIPEIIKEMGFDGYVCGCGSQIYMNEELLFSSSIDVYKRQHSGILSSMQSTAPSGTASSRMQCSSTNLSVP